MAPFHHDNIRGRRRAPPPASTSAPRSGKDVSTTACSHLQQEGLRLGNFARSDALEGGVLPGVDLHVPQPREMRHLVCGGRSDVNQPAKNSVTRPDTLTSRLAPPPRRVGLPPCMEGASAANPLTADQTLLLLPCSGAPCWSLPSLLGPDVVTLFRNAADVFEVPGFLGFH